MALAAAGAVVPPISVNILAADPAALPGEIPAGHPLVLATPALGWTPGPAAPGAAAQVILAQHQLLAGFGARLRAGPNPADAAAARNTNPLTLALNGPCWVRILDELIASGLLTALPVNADARDVQDAVLGLTIATPGNLVPRGLYM